MCQSSTSLNTQGDLLQALATFHVLNSPMWLTANVLSSTDMEHFHHHSVVLEPDLPNFKLILSLSVLLKNALCV